MPSHYPRPRRIISVRTCGVATNGFLTSREGFLVFGDALCSFNPIFGQGMTVACVESLALRNCLEDGQQGLAKRFFRATSRLVDVPWQITVGSDLQNSKVEGNRTMQARFINWYIAKFFQAAQYDGVLATKFLEVANLMEQPAALISLANSAVSLEGVHCPKSSQSTGRVRWTKLNFINSSARC